jgi:hypothetical protein
MTKLPALPPKPGCDAASPSRFKRALKWLLVAAFLAALVWTIVGMGPLAFLLALGSMFVFGGIQAGVEALVRRLRDRMAARAGNGPTGGGSADRRGPLAPPPAGSWRFVALRFRQRFAQRLRPDLH